MISIHVSAKRRLGTLRVLHRTSCLRSSNIVPLSTHLIHRSTNFHRNKFVLHSHPNTGLEMNMYSGQQRIVSWTREDSGQYPWFDPGYQCFSQSSSPVSCMLCSGEDTCAIFPEQRALSISLMNEFCTRLIAIDSHALCELQQEICLCMWACLPLEVESNGFW